MFSNNYIDLCVFIVSVLLLLLVLVSLFSLSFFCFYIFALFVKITNRWSVFAIIYFCVYISLCICVVGCEGEVEVWGDALHVDFAGRYHTSKCIISTNVFFSLFSEFMCLKYALYTVYCRLCTMWKRSKLMHAKFFLCLCFSLFVLSLRHKNKSRSILGFECVFFLVCCFFPFLMSFLVVCV